MEKYRIIETKVPVLSENTQGVVNFIPEIEYNSTYHVEELVIDKFLWMTFSDWIEVRFWGDYGRDRFNSIEEAKRWIEFREKEIKTKIVAKL